MIDMLLIRSSDRWHDGLLLSTLVFVDFEVVKSYSDVSFPKEVDEKERVKQTAKTEANPRLLMTFSSRLVGTPFISFLMTPTVRIFRAAHSHSTNSK